MAWITLTKEERFTFDTLHALFALIGGVLGIYFVMRWGITLGRVDDNSREMLLGQTLNELLTDTNTIHTIVAIYVGVVFFKFMVAASGWKQYLESSRRRLVYHQQRERIVSEY